MSDLVSRIQPFLEPAQALLQRHPRTIASTTLAAVLLPWFVDNYRKWRDLGGLGLPNYVGWPMALFAKPFGRETTSTGMYDANPIKESWLKDPDTIPERRGDRPITGWHFLPHRQLNRIPTEDIKKRLEEVFDKHAKTNSDLVEVTISPHEQAHDAIVIASARATPHAIAKHALREVAHFHHVKDYSMHMVLAPQDCKLLIERGWAERHPISGTVALPQEYLFVYAPRNEEELEVVERMLVAAIGYMTDSRSVN